MPVSAAKKLSDPLLDKQWVLNKLSEVGLLSDIRTERGALELLSDLVTIRSYAACVDIIHEGTSGSEMVYTSLRPSRCL